MDSKFNIISKDKDSIKVEMINYELSYNRACRSWDFQIIYLENKFIVIDGNPDRAMNSAIFFHL